MSHLLKTIREREVGVLLHAGDVFDNANPPNSALRQYYNFLRDLAKSRCHHSVIIGGNHDSVSTLNAPRNLLSAFNIHVVGGASAQLENEILPLKNENNELEAIICAVPFLRERDLQMAESGERASERHERLRDGILAHYQQAAELAQQVPIIAMGHLYAAGATSSDSEKDIPIGNLGQVDASRFPEIFDYVALGHLHRPQMVGKREHIRYAGSPIPLSFSESSDEKSVLLLDFQNGKLVDIEKIPIPVHRKLLRWRGSPEQLIDQILQFEKPDNEATPWIEAVVELLHFQPDVDQNLREAAAGKPLDILKVTTNYNRSVTALGDGPELQDLHELSVTDVFSQRCESANIAEDEKENMQGLFRDLLDWMEEKRTQ